MLIRRILSALGFAAIGALAAWAGVTGAASLEPAVLKARDARLAKAAASIRAELKAWEAQGVKLVAAFARTDLGADIKGLQSARNKKSPSGRVPGWVKKKIDDLSGRVAAKVQKAKDAPGTPLSSVTLVSEKAVVVWSDAADVPVGELMARLVEKPAPKAKAKEKEGDTSAAGAQAAQDSQAAAKGNNAKPKAPPITAPAAHFEGHPGVATVLNTRSPWTRFVGTQGALVQEVAVPVSLRNKPMGVLLARRQMQAYPAAEGVSTFFAASGEIISGLPPAGFAAPAEVSDQVQKVAAGEVSAVLPLVGEAGLPLLSASSLSVGHFALVFDIPNSGELRGYVAMDWSSFYGPVAGAQWMAVLLGLAMAAAGFVVIFLAGRRQRRGLAGISDFLGMYHQGLSTEKKIHEREYPGDLHRLIRLINTTLEQARKKPGGGRAAVDDVIRAQEIEPPPEVGELDFGSITEGGGGGDHPFDADADGEGYSPVEAPEQLADEVEGGEDMPDIPEVFDALDGALGESAPAAENGLDGLDGDDDGDLGLVASEGPPPEVPAPGLGESSGPPPADDDDEDDGLDTFDDFGDGDAGDALSLQPDVTAGLEEGDDEDDGADLIPPMDDPEPAADAATDGLEMSAEMMAALGDEDDEEPEDDEADDNDVGDLMLASDDEDLSAAANAAAAALDGGADDSDEDDEPVSPAFELDLDDADDAEADSEEQVFRSVYQQFIDTRRDCGESLDLSFEKFASRLRQSRQAVLDRHDCNDVRFEVYVKNGKAALRASPVL